MLPPVDTDTAPLNVTPVFQTPPNSGPPPPYVQPPNSGPPPSYVQWRTQIRSTTSSNGDHAHLPPTIRPTLDPGSQNVCGPCTPTNQRVLPGSSGVSGSITSSGSSFLTPGNHGIANFVVLILHLACPSPSGPPPPPPPQPHASTIHLHMIAAIIKK